jgi:hypothetical protein
MQPKEHPPIYQITVAGHLDERWLRWFEGLSVSQLPTGETAISGMMDHAALHGILTRIRDLGLEIISVQHYASTDDLPPTGENDGALIV